MTIQELLSPDSVRIDQAVRDKAHLISILAGDYARRSGLDERTIAEALAAREKLGSTGVGGGIAIPHARLAGLAQPMALAVRLRKPIAFDAVDDQPVDLVIGLLLPEGADARNLTCLAGVSRRLRNKDLVQRLRSAQSAAAMYQLLIARDD